MRTLTIVMVAGLGLVASGCTSMLDMEKAKTAMSTGISEQIGLPVASVTCPETREMKAGDAFECKAAITDGGMLTVKVTQKDAEGNINWSVVNTEGLLDLATVEASIQKGLKEQAGVDAVANCGGAKYRSAQPGKTFDCTAKGGDQETGIVVTMTDDKGNISWATK